MRGRTAILRSCPFEISCATGATKLFRSACCASVREGGDKHATKSVTKVRRVPRSVLSRGRQLFNRPPLFESRDYTNKLLTYSVSVATRSQHDCRQILFAFSDKSC